MLLTKLYYRASNSFPVVYIPWKTSFKKCEIFILTVTLIFVRLTEISPKLKAHPENPHFWYL